MFSYIDTLRRKPLRARRQLAVGISIVVVAVIALAWGTVRFVSFDTKPHPTQPIPVGIVGPYDE